LIKYIEENYKWRARFDRIDVVTNAVDLTKFYPRSLEEQREKDERDKGKSKREDLVICYYC
jgi:hypothetical protein